MIVGAYRYRINLYLHFRIILFSSIQFNRKSASLSMATRKKLVAVTCQAVCSMSSTLTSAARNSQDENVYVVPQSFRDALACHLYMLYTIMIFMESETKAVKSLGNVVSAKGKNKTQEKERLAEVQDAQMSREACASAMLAAANAMAWNKSNLWKRGVPDENVISLPCRIAYQMLENATGAVARKLASADIAMQMIAATLDSADCLLNTVISALVDMLHSFEHMAPLAADLCCLVKEEPQNKLAIELLREIGRLDAGAAAVSDTSGKASGIRNVAPFINELAEKKPQLVLEHIALVLPHLQHEPYNLRSAIVVAIGHLLIRCVDHNGAEEDEDEDEGADADADADSSDLVGARKSKAKKISDIKTSLYDILLEHVYDVSSYTRVAVMKTWAALIEAQSLPVDKLVAVTELAIDRLQDKTVMVRRSAMQVSQFCLLST